MSERRDIQTRVLRRGNVSTETPDLDWLEYTPAERIEAVWTLTKACMAWGGEIDGEPRLQRSVSRIQRSRS